MAVQRSSDANFVPELSLRTKFLRHVNVSRKTYVLSACLTTGETCCRIKLRYTRLDRVQEGQRVERYDSLFGEQPFNAIEHSRGQNTFLESRHVYARFSIHSAKRSPPLDDIGGPVSGNDRQVIPLRVADRSTRQIAVLPAGESPGCNGIILLAPELANMNWLRNAEILHSWSSGTNSPKDPLMVSLLSAATVTLSFAKSVTIIVPEPIWADAVLTITAMKTRTYFLMCRSPLVTLLPLSE